MVYKFMEGVRLILTGKEAFIEDTNTLEKFGVGGAAVTFAQLIDGERSMDQILDELIKIYGNSVEPYILSRDLERFIMDLLESNLVFLVKMEQPKFDFLGMNYPGNR